MYVSIVFFPILWTQTGITAMVGTWNAQKLPMFFRLILVKFILMSRTLREEWRALIIRPLICISLNKNTDYWYLPHSLKHTDTFKWPSIREFYRTVLHVLMNLKSHPLNLYTCTVWGKDRELPMILTQFPIILLRVKTPFLLHFLREIVWKFRKW